MSHFGDFMDGVPVKISEKYKRPPRIDLPYSVHECPQRAQNVVDSVRYCSTFETNVLAKLKELRSAKETKKSERRHRLQLLEEAKQKKLDAIAAAEAEEKLKLLSVSDVTYPSTDEISSISDKPDKDCDSIPTREGNPEPEMVPLPEVSYPACSQPEPNLNILQPIQLQSNYPENSLLDDPDPLQEIKKSAKINKIPQYNHNVETLTFKDFENDTSSPFDNVELKTINDMELLAQILQSQRDTSGSCNPQQYVPEQTYVGVPSCASQAHIEGLSYLPNTYPEQPLQGPGLMYAAPQHYPVSNGYYIPTDNACDNQMQMENINMYMPNYQYYVPNNPYPIDPTYYVNQMPVNNDVPQPSDSTYIPQPYYFHNPPNPMSMLVTEYPLPEQGQQNLVQENTSHSSQSVTKSRSRSVPDIVKELDEELASAQQRANERSYNESPGPSNIPRSSSSSEKKGDRKGRRRQEQLPNPYGKLPLQLQGMCQKIHSMGFPLDRVARVCTLVGENDKKVIEGLLILGELMDLGFTEGRASAALAKHEFNRDKALDDLVS